jgi:hypothetical protein
LQISKKNVCKWMWSVQTCVVQGLTITESSPFLRDTQK